MEKEFKTFINEKISCFETKFKSKIIKDIPKLYFNLKRVIINSKTASNEEDLSYIFYLSLKEVFSDVKVISSSNNDINYYGYNFSENLISLINNIQIIGSYGRNTYEKFNIYYLKYQNNSISLIIINSDEIDNKKDLQILTAIKHIVQIAKFNIEPICA